MCYGIVRQADGLVLVESEPGRGARFSVLLPREGSSAEEGVVSAAPIVVPGRETVLLVEDDSTVRVVTGRILRELGYTVLEAASAAEARTVAAAAAGRIDLLLTDVVMRAQRTGAGGSTDADPSGLAGGVHVGLHRRRDPPSGHRA